MSEEREELDGMEGQCDDCGLDDDLVFTYFDETLCVDCLAAKTGKNFIVGSDGIARETEE